MEVSTLLHNELVEAGISKIKDTGDDPDRNDIRDIDIQISAFH
jgi:hypothetical protein